MSQKMRAAVLYADWDPKPDFKLGAKDIEGRQTYLGSKVWRNPRVVIEERDIPKPGPGEVLIEVKACGICGSDVHMAQPDEQGYIWYPGLTGFPAVLGHEFSGVVVEAGPGAINKATNRPFKGGEEVCAEEMLWCGRCQPCADGYPNHCERLDEIGFNVDGAFAKYIVVPDRVVWSLEPLKERYQGMDLFLAGSLVEPTSVAYNAVIQRGGGIKPGDNVVICGGGPVGLAACAILKRQGAARVILSEPEPARAELGLKMGADYVINPLKEDFVHRVLEITDGYGAKLYLEATGLPTVVYPQIEQVIWEARGLNATVVVVARADAKMPVTGEVLQVRRAQIVGAQGHSGEGTFPRVIQSMATGMNMLPLITKQITLDEVPENLVTLRTDRKECKITVRLDKE
ncbi:MULTISPECIES: scyllo-inosose 3-dehydrogenase [Desulfofundulus]|uniref:Threonine dehydrogenase-like Zn-dependent dehydrogenase n=1 Tax=Desulfofundulus luciae TaxID=74702 RepID=A0ABU0AZT9_9FIRM|nr:MULTISPECIES: scyllo-inosose 3-dehydrogenase [Desulfofundulus]MDQ0285975.1 threonine dehydrogenase-like Zn-dependent dehydrogenase [Desulfofundulus luciae]